MADLALAASARDWPDRLHRHLLDHGGGRVVTRVMSPEQVQEAVFDVLLIDDVCSFLTPRLVNLVKNGGSEVIGVYSPSDGPDAKRHLLECGISDVIESGARPEEFLDKIVSTISHRVAAPSLEATERSSGFAIGVTGPCEGVGMTEVAVALGFLTAGPLLVGLVDMDTNWPGVAQRLDLPVHPNLRTAIDFTMHRTDRLEDAMLRVGELAIIGGLADMGAGSPVSHVEMTMLIDAVRGSTDLVIADLGSYAQTESVVLGAFDTVIVVGAGDPTGISRLLRTVQSIRTTVTEDLVVIVNRLPPGRFYHQEARREVVSLFPDVPVVTISHDRRLAGASWDGVETRSGPFANAIGSLASVVKETLSP